MFSKSWCNFDLSSIRVNRFGGKISVVAVARSKEIACPVVLGAPVKRWLD
jgi:hypothetical protein